ncbi:hypothetical protein AVEN_195306-1 [Araneus ventricosus]|uniref:Uncharacterized protein n=1 Tax=Araneus ventricosus TaxID=182803 RepID=A0A4Y2ICI1_ARAVE|nr:hypothetical protein AVEN_195306-1 [Araneus ventricosus]
MTSINGYAEKLNGVECHHSICVEWIDREWSGVIACKNNQRCSPSPNNAGCTSVLGGQCGWDQLIGNLTRIHIRFSMNEIVVRFHDVAL